MMVPAAVVDPTLKTLVPLLERDDVIIDGGNSYYHDDIRRAAELKPKGIHYVDVGTSGGVWGSERGYCLMIGGDETVVRRIDPIFAALAPKYRGGAPHARPGEAGRHRRARLPALRRERRGPLRQDGPQRHRVRHDGLLRGRAEHPSPRQRRQSSRTVDAETTPLRDPEHYPYDLNLADIAEVWRRGSVIASWLLDLAATALLDSPDLAKFAGRVSDSGEGRWTIKAAIDEAVPAPVLSAALYERFSSRGQDDFADKMLSALRYQFGGHEGKGRRQERQAPDGILPLGRAGALRCDGRSRPQDDLPGALRDGETRRLSRFRSSASPSRSGVWSATAQTRDRQHQAIGRDR
jgi:6-phosphogluconate dehydrogenase